VKRPLVGITSYVVSARFGAWELESALVPVDYVRAIESAGGRPVLVPPSTEGLAETLDALDGVVFSGGSDIDPALYRHEPHDETDGIVRERDDAELALIRAALERELPVLAICRGAQVLNVARGGDLVQHLPEVVGHDGHKPTPGAFGRHDVVVEPDSRLRGLLGERISVESHHHQGFGRLGEGLRVTAHAADGLPEAVEVAGPAFALGVLWHPEAGDDGALFEALVEEARRYRSARRR
jgi:gamma-glutamyl-gamma-aminobutyrate hydrolase PuuD